MSAAHREGPNPFLEGTAIQHSWDSTSLGTLKECPQKYKLSIVDGWRPKRQSTNLSFGSHIHKAIERFESHIAQGLAREDALHKIVRGALEESRGMEPYKTKSRETLLYSIVDYVDHYSADRTKTVKLSDGTAACELSFRTPMDLVFPNHILKTITFCGHLDRVTYLEGTPYVVDMKTTMNTLGGDSSFRFFAGFDPDSQFSGYCFGSHAEYGIPVRGVIVEGIQIAKTFTRFERGISHRTFAQIDEWRTDTSVWIGHAVQYAEMNYWPRNEKSCHKWGGCAFRGICGRDPHVRDAFLATDFTQESPWNPLVDRHATNNETLELEE